MDKRFLVKSHPRWSERPSEFGILRTEGSVSVSLELQPQLLRKWKIWDNHRLTKAWCYTKSPRQKLSAIPISINLFNLILIGKWIHHSAKEGEAQSQHYPKYQLAIWCLIRGRKAAQCLCGHCCHELDPPTGRVLRIPQISDSLRIRWSDHVWEWPDGMGTAHWGGHWRREFSLEQKEDILYDNAATFLGLSEKEIQMHKGNSGL